MQAISVDVCIIGGGLAGLAAAIGLRKAGASVVVIDRRTDGGDPHRGDWVQPRSATMLKEWGVEFAGRAATPATQIRVEWGSHVVARRAIKGASWFLPAVQLEAAMRDRARAMGVDLRLGWQIQMLLHDQGKKGRIAGLTAANGGDFAAFQAKLVVGADGRSSLVREQLGLGFRKSEGKFSLLALEAEVSPGVNLEGDTLTISMGPRGGGLAAPLPNRRLRVLAAVAPGEAEKLSRQPPQTLAVELPERAPLPLSSTIDPAKLRVYESPIAGHATNYASDGAVCIGEAAHPAALLTFDGVTMAFLDAAALARHVGPVIAGETRAIDKALVKFETERWPDNERRLVRSRQALKWLRPKSAFWGLLLRTPLAPLFLRSLFAYD